MENETVRGVDYTTIEDSLDEVDYSQKQTTVTTDSGSLQLTKNDEKGCTLNIKLKELSEPRAKEIIDVVKEWL